MTRRLRTTTAAAAAGLLTALLAACSGGGDGGQPTAGSDGDKGHNSPEPAAVEAGHIHGLGIDPADGMLYVATHEGILAVDDQGKAELVSDRADYMGFAVAGPGTFLGSGHPAPGSGDHSNRGLIESKDAGRTWQNRSLDGEADFHTLEYAHDTIYGYDSTRGMLRVTENGTDWDDRGTLAALDIAVSPKDPGRLLATTQDGVATSTDGGRTFADGTEPVLTHVDWPEARALYGIDPGGALHRSTDGGKIWKETGTVPGGQPQALTAVDADRVLAATQDGVYDSVDGGKTFAKRLSILPADGH